MMTSREALKPLPTFHCLQTETRFGGLSTLFVLHCGQSRRGPTVPFEAGMSVSCQYVVQIASGDDIRLRDC